MVNGRSSNVSCRSTFEAQGLNVHASLVTTGKDEFEQSVWTTTFPWGTGKLGQSRCNNGGALAPNDLSFENVCTSRKSDSILDVELVAHVEQPKPRKTTPQSKVNDCASLGMTRSISCGLDFVASSSLCSFDESMSCSVSVVPRIEVIYMWSK